MILNDGNVTLLIATHEHEHEHEPREEIVRRTTSTSYLGRHVTCSINASPERATFLASKSLACDHSLEPHLFNRTGPAPRLILYLDLRREASHRLSVSDTTMPDQDDFNDSTDWLPTPLAALAPLDSSLRCQVCKDFFTTPMMTSCSHTFCSLCIRRYLSQEGRCPACRETDQEVKLRRNWAVEELVANFSASRKELLTFATAQAAAAAEKSQEENDELEEKRPKKRRKVATAPAATTAITGVERRSTRSQSRRVASDAASSQQSAPPTQEVIEDSEDEGSVYEDMESIRSSHFANGTSSTQPNDGLVECPCCHRRMKETLINSHLDKCIQGDSFTPVEENGRTSSPAAVPSTRPNPSRPHVAPPGTIAYSQRKTTLHTERLPFLNYSLFTDTALRKKLKELGIRNDGSKDLMRRRHTEWVNLWNANCDSTTPVSKRELLRELKVWEDTLGRQQQGDRNSASAGFMAKDFDRDRHIKSQKGNFDNLIRQAKEKAREKAEAKTQAQTEVPEQAVTAKTVVMPDVEAEGAIFRQQPATTSAESGLLDALDASTTGHTSNGVLSHPPEMESHAPAPAGEGGAEAVIEIPSSSPLAPPLSPEVAAGEVPAHSIPSQTAVPDPSPSKRFFV